MGHKITLGTRPKNFTHTVEVPLHEGTTGSIEVLYRYRTRSEFGQFIDELADAAQVARPQTATADEVDNTVRAAMEATNGTNAKYLLQVMDGWNLEAEFGLPAMQQLCDELPGVAIKLMEDYRLACTEGRLGN